MAVRYRGEKWAGYNKPKFIDHPKYKASVLARQKVDGKFKIKKIMFGDAKAPHNQSPEARANFKSRFAKLIEKYKNDKHSRMFWSNSFLWNPKGVKRNP